MKKTEATCWSCGKRQRDILLPLSRTEACGDCRRDLHVCRMCRFYDTSVNNACREPVADFVADKTRANFCGYLELREDSATFVSTGAGASTPELDELFGLGDSKQDNSSPTSELDALFGLKDD